MTRRLRSAVVVEVPEAIPAVGAWLDASAAAKPSHGVPPHVTILFPFVPAAEIDAELFDALRALAERSSCSRSSFESSAGRACCTWRPIPRMRSPS